MPSLGKQSWFWITVSQRNSVQNAYNFVFRAVITGDIALGHLQAQLPAASFTKEVNSRLAKRPLVFNGRLANRGVTSLVKETLLVTRRFGSYKYGTSITDSLSPVDAYTACVKGLAIIGSGNGLSPIRRQSIISSNGGFFSNGPPEIYFRKI